MSFMIIIVSLIFLSAILLIGKTTVTLKFRREINRLFLQPVGLSSEKFDYRQLANLPEPVQRYFRHVLKDGQPYIRYVRLRHTGDFRTGLDKKWIKIRGEEYFNADKPGFVWKGITSMFTARDMFIGGKGRLVVSLFSLFNIVNARGAKYDQGELLRWLAESVWFPTNLLPGGNLKWDPIDWHTANLSYHYNGLSLSSIVTINDSGEIMQFQSERYMGETKPETWIVKLSDYKTVNGIILPMLCEAIWKLGLVEHSYAKFQLTTIEYNIPRRF